MYFKRFIRLFVRATYLLFEEPATVDKKLVSCCKRKVVVFTTVEKSVPLSFVGNYLTEVACLCWVLLIKLSTLEEAVCGTKKHDARWLFGGCKDEHTSWIGTWAQPSIFCCAILLHSFYMRSSQVTASAWFSKTMASGFALNAMSFEEVSNFIHDFIKFPITWFTSKIYSSLSWLSSDIWSS